MTHALALLLMLAAENRFDRALAEPIVSVMDKADVPPSGDKHDYLSYGPYWFPDPSKKDGLPYIRKDGYRNEELIRRGDADAFSAMVRAVRTLAESKERRHAESAAVRIRAWFLDPTTRMNPHLEFGQAIPGRTKGRGEGLISMRGLLDVVDAIPALEKAGVWTRADDTAFRAWMSDWVKWLDTSAVAREEKTAKNNHGSWFAAQAIGLQVFLGNKSRAREIAQEVPARIAWQIEAGGRQPLETARQDGVSYSLFNLRGLATAAKRAEAVGVNLWDPALQRAFDYVAPVVRGERAWGYRQLKKVPVEELAEITRLSGGRLK